MEQRCGQAATRVERKVDQAVRELKAELKDVLPLRGLMSDISELLSLHARPRLAALERDVGACWHRVAAVEDVVEQSRRSARERHESMRQLQGAGVGESVRHAAVECASLASAPHNDGLGKLRGTQNYSRNGRACAREGAAHAPSEAAHFTSLPLTGELDKSRCAPPGKQLLRMTSNTSSLSVGARLALAPDLLVSETSLAAVEENLLARMSRTRTELDEALQASVKRRGAELDEFLEASVRRLSQRLDEGVRAAEAYALRKAEASYCRSEDAQRGALEELVVDATMASGAALLRATERLGGEVARERQQRLAGEKRRDEDAHAVQREHASEQRASLAATERRLMEAAAAVAQRSAATECATLGVSLRAELRATPGGCSAVGRLRCEEPRGAGSAWTAWVTGAEGTSIGTIAPSGPTWSLTASHPLLNRNNFGRARKTFTGMSSEETSSSEASPSAAQEPSGLSFLQRRAGQATVDPFATPSAASVAASERSAASAASAECVASVALVSPGQGESTSSQSSVCGTLPGPLSVPLREDVNP